MHDSLLYSPYSYVITVGLPILPRLPGCSEKNDIPYGWGSIRKGDFVY